MNYYLTQIILFNIINNHKQKIEKFYLVPRLDLIGTTYKQDLALNNPQWLICHKT